MFNFNPTKDTGHKTGGNLIPAGSLTYALVTVRGLKKSSTTGGEYVDLELTCYGGPWENRKIFTNVMNPLDQLNSEAARNMGFGAVLHMMEAAGLVNINDANTYAPLNSMGFDTMMAALDNRVVAIKVSVKKDDNYPDKNQVGEWLTPNPARGTAAKAWQALNEGRHTMKPQPAAGAPAQFGAQQGQPAAPAAFGQAQQRPQQSMQQAPQQPQQFAQPAQTAAAFGQPGRPAPGFQGAPTQLQQPAANPPAPQPQAQPGAAPAWLANGQQPQTRPDGTPF